MHLKIAGVTVLYNPEIDVLESIYSYFNQVDKLYIIDNSEPVINEQLIQKIKQLKKIEYICNNSNIGIAAALNIGAEKALLAGYNFILTMDQDSTATPDMVDKMIKFAEDNIGIIAPNHLIKPKSTNIPEKEICEEEIIVMTSGNILNLSAYRVTGKFNEALFVDYVDHDYCLRLKNNNYRILRINNAVLYHKVGNTVEKKFFFKTVFPANHNPVRLYYQTRNRFYLRKIYKEKYRMVFTEDLILFRNSIIKILLFEKNKLRKIGMILKGYIDYRKNRLGKFKNS